MMGEPFSFLFEGMQMDRVAGATVPTRRVIGHAHRHGSSSGPWSGAGAHLQARAAAKPTVSRSRT
jgi:hypothetical protein